jgi:hypothetical protein
MSPVAGNCVLRKMRCRKNRCDFKRNTKIELSCATKLTQNQKALKLNLKYNQARKLKMPISPELLEILICPACKAKVEIKPDESGLKCVSCKRVYPIREEIPVMLVDEATIENEAN